MFWAQANILSKGFSIIDNSKKVWHLPQLVPDQCTITWKVRRKHPRVSHGHNVWNLPWLKWATPAGIQSIIKKSVIFGMYLFLRPLTKWTLTSWLLNDSMPFWHFASTGPPVWSLVDNEGPESLSLPRLQASLPSNVCKSNLNRFALEELPKWFLRSFHLKFMAPVYCTVFSYVAERVSYISMIYCVVQIRKRTRAHVSLCLIPCICVQQIFWTKIRQGHGVLSTRHAPQVFRERRYLPSGEDVFSPNASPGPEDCVRMTSTSGRLRVSHYRKTRGVRVVPLILDIRVHVCLQLLMPQELSRRSSCSFSSKEPFLCLSIRNCCSARGKKCGYCCRQDHWLQRAHMCACRRFWSYLLLAAGSECCVAVLHLRFRNFWWHTLFQLGRHWVGIVMRWSSRLTAASGHRSYNTLLSLPTAKFRQDFFFLIKTHLKVISRLRISIMLTSCWKIGGERPISLLCFLLGF